MRLAFYPLAVAFVIVVLLLAGCGAMPEQKPLDPKVEYREVAVPTPVACFDAADKPIMPTPVYVDVDNATPDQIAEANEADLRALRIFAAAADALLRQCQTKGTP